LNKTLICIVIIIVGSVQAYVTNKKLLILAADGKFT